MIFNGHHTSPKMATKIPLLPGHICLSFRQEKDSVSLLLKSGLALWLLWPTDAAEETLFQLWALPYSGLRASVFALLKASSVKFKLSYWEEKPQRKTLEDEPPHGERGHKKEHGGIPAHSQHQNTGLGRKPSWTFHPAQLPSEIRCTSDRQHYV